MFVGPVLSLISSGAHIRAAGGPDLCGTTLEKTYFWLWEWRTLNLQIRANELSQNLPLRGGHLGMGSLMQKAA